MLSILLRYGDRMLLRSAPSCQLRDAGGWRVGVEASGSVPNYIVHLPYPPLLMCACFYACFYTSGPIDSCARSRAGSSRRVRPGCTARTGRSSPSRCENCGPGGVGGGGPVTSLSRGAVRAEALRCERACGVHTLTLTMARVHTGRRLTRHSKRAAPIGCGDSLSPRRA